MYGQYMALLAFLSLCLLSAIRDMALYHMPLLHQDALVPKEPNINRTKNYKPTSES